MIYLIIGITAALILLMVNRKLFVRGAVLLGFILLTGILVPVIAEASDYDSQTVRVGYYENEVFQEGAQDGAVKTGYAYEYYQKISEYTGWQYDYVYGEFGDLYQMLLNGDIDLLAGLAWREDRDAIIGYPEAAMGNEAYNLVKHAGDEDITTDPSTLNRKKIGVLDSAMAATLQTWLVDHAVQAEAVLFRDYGPLFEAFDSHEIDVLAAEGDGAYGRANAELLYAFGASDDYLCVSVSRRDLLDELNIAQTELAGNEPNYIPSLRNKYYPVSISSRAFSTDEKRWLAAHDTLRIGYLNNYLPYSDTDDSGAVTGLVRDIVPRLLDELGVNSISVSYIGYGSYDKMIAALGTGEIDTAFPVGGGLYYSEESGIFQTSPVVSAATELVHCGEYTEETIAHFAVNENNSMQYYFVLTYYPDAEITFYPSIAECLKAVSDGKVGCTTLNGLRANDILRNSRYNDLALLQTTHNDDRCFGVQIGNAGLLRLLNRGINMLGSDYAQNLAFRYTDQLYTYSVWDMIRDNMAVFGSIIFGISALIILFLIRDSRRSRREIYNKEKARIELEKANAELAKSQEAKQRELEERLALQEELLDQQSRREQQDKMITALATDYRCVYHVDLDRDDAVCYRADPTDPEQTGEGIHFAYLERFKWYAEHSVTDNYREGFLRFIEPDYVREALAKKPIIVYRYLARRGGREYYEMIRMAGVRHAEDRDDHIVHAVGLGLTIIDEEMRETMAKSQALAEALAAAEDANKAKTAFLSNMSHEIRTPMNAIIGLNNIAMNDPTASEKLKEYLGKIGASAQHLLGIINDILDMSCIESGRMTIKKEEFSFAKALDQVNTIISGQCRDKGLIYDCRVTGQVDDYYIGDVMKLKQVMINILGNAVKFTPEGGTVSFEIEEGPRYEGQATLRFIISDTGIGMSKEYLPHIFEPFSQEDASSTSRYGSTGLGMPITKSIVELMNGTIDVASEKGKGTTFTVTVTLGESDRKQRRAEEDALSPQEMSVLVIDDDRIALEHAGIILGQVGVSCDTAESGWEGIDKVRIRHGRREDYDLILVDWKMPEMDGIETTRHIREIVGHDTPVIILTSFNWDEIAEEAKAAGVDTFLPKPLFSGSIMDEFKEAFRRKHEVQDKKTADLKGRRILLAEDVAVNAEIMMMVLSMREMEADLAENGRIAVDMFMSHEPGYYDAVLMDMRMPEMNGLEATRVIRASEHADAKTIPIIALTANAFDEDVQRSLQAGLNAHLSKPVEPEALFETLEKLIAQKECMI